LQRNGRSKPGLRRLTVRSVLGWLSANTLLLVASVASLGPGVGDGLAVTRAYAGPLTTPALPTVHEAGPKLVAVGQAQDEPRFSDSKAYKHSWIQVDGVRTHYIEAGNGPPVILVHGALAWESGEVNFGDVVGPLSKHFHVIAGDMVGYGYTKPRGPQDYTGHAQGDFLIHFIDALRVGPIFIAGGSHGGFLTQYVALERPDLIKKLVITNSLNGTSSNRPPMTESDKKPLPSQTKEQIRNMLERYYKHKDLVTEERVRLVHDVYQRNYQYSNLRSQSVFPSVERYNQNLSYKGKHISEWGGKLKMPVLLVWSEPGSKIEWGLAHLARVPGSEMHILPWSGHHVFTDQSARWVQVVTDWLLNEPPRPPN
jgi:pimeloyl-ACP methyl ester carboxylesterase